jgi:hypothetical protein
MHRKGLGIVVALTSCSDAVYEKKLLMMTEKLEREMTRALYLFAS